MSTPAVRLPPLAFLSPDASPRSGGSASSAAAAGQWPKRAGTQQKNDDTRTDTHTNGQQRNQSGGQNGKKQQQKKQDEGSPSKKEQQKGSKSSSSSSSSSSKKPPPTPTASLALARLALLSLLLLLGSFLAFLSLGLYLTALINNSWVEMPNADSALKTQTVRGKTTEQYVLLAVAVSVGGVAIIWLGMILAAARQQRMPVGGRFAGVLKVICILLIAAMTGLGYATVGLQSPPDRSMGQSDGAAESYARMALEYGVISVVLLTLQEALFRIFLFWRLHKYGAGFAQERSLKLSKRLAMDKVREARMR